jgi:hypothetical protein
MDYHCTLKKERDMSRTSKILLLTMLVVFTLACNAINTRVNQVQDVAKTAEAVGTAIASAVPIETLQALPSALPMQTLEAIPSALPDFQSMFDPKGTPVSEWNGIPIMPQATAGQEADANNYSFKFTGTTKEATDFYNDQMVKLGWTSMFSMPGSDSGAVLAFQKGDAVVTLTIVTTDNSTVVVLTKA